MRRRAEDPSAGKSPVTPRAIVWPPRLARARALSRPSLSWDVGTRPCGQPQPHSVTFASVDPDSAVKFLQQRGCSSADALNPMHSHGRQRLLQHRLSLAEGWARRFAPVAPLVRLLPLHAPGDVGASSPAGFDNNRAMRTGFLSWPLPNLAAPGTCTRGLQRVLHRLTYPCTVSSTWLRLSAPPGFPRPDGTSKFRDL